MTITDSPRRSVLGHWARIVAVLSMHFFVVLLVLLVLCKIVPEFSLFFQRANVAFSPITMQVIRLSNFFVVSLAWILVVGMVADTAVVVLLASQASARQWLLSAYSQLWLLAVIVLLVYVAVGIADPFMKNLIQPMGTAAGPAT